MKLCKAMGEWWLGNEGKWWRLEGFRLDDWLKGEDPVGELRGRMALAPGAGGPGALELPLESQEVWGAGVTYERSKVARMEESAASASLYDRVYAADRPELFFKANARRCVGDGGKLTLRQDSRWIVPEPELGLVISAGGKVVGFTIGDDLSCRDIEGENALYLPQAKIWDGCCALGPCIVINDGAADITKWTMRLVVLRKGWVVFAGETPISRMKRSPEELAKWLFRHQSFPVGVVLLTGTGIVPPDDLSLQSGDVVRMEVPEIGVLSTTVE